MEKKKMTGNTVLKIGVYFLIFAISFVWVNHAINERTLMPPNFFSENWELWLGALVVFLVCFGLFKKDIFGSKKDD